MSESFIRDTPTNIGEPGSMLLLKLHGSMNWRIPLGYPKPYVIEAVRHHEPWFEHYGRWHEKIDVQTLEPFLEKDAMIIPPILTKVELGEQPVLRLTWTNAIDALEESTRVVFLERLARVTD